MTRVRLYCTVSIYEEEGELEVLEVHRPSEHRLGDDLLLKWHGIIEEYGNREAQLTLDRPEGKSPIGYPYDVFRRLAIQNAKGERISGGISYHEDTNLCRLFLKDGETPVKAKVWYPKGLKTYGGFVEFRDVPVVSLR